MNVLSLCSNIGVGEAYLKPHDFIVKVANEIDPERSKIYSEIYPETTMICGDIKQKDIKSKIINESLLNNVRLIIATPPCQGISKAGRKKDFDIRNTIIIEIIEIFNKVKPDFMLIENVEDYSNAMIIHEKKVISIKDFIIENIDPVIYGVEDDICNSKYFGTPQSRKRRIIRIYNKKYKWVLPEKTNIINLKQAIGDLPSLEANEKSSLLFHYAKKHHKNHIEWLKHTPTGQTAFDNEERYRPNKNGRLIKGYKSNYKRMSWDKPAQTVTMSSGGLSCQCNCHPGYLKEDGTYSDARALTPLELFRVMGLPDNWGLPHYLSDNKIRKYLGEGLPPKMLLTLLQKIKT